MEDLSVFQFNDFREYLKYRIDRQLRSSTGVKRSNLGRLAKSLGYRSPSLLTMVMKGQRIPSDEFIAALSESWDLKTDEKDYLQILVQLERNKSRGRDVSAMLKKLEQLGLAKDSHKISLSQFNLLSDWQCLVIKELIGSPDFKEDPQWISRKLRRKVTAAEVQRALDVLLELGLTRRDPESGKLELNTGFVETTHDIPSAAIRAHHRAMMERAKDALEEQDASERHYNSLSLRVKPDRVTDAKAALLDFIKKFNSEYGDADSSRVYQLNLQFFEHTQKEAEDETP
jgi:uncharacterized protein (TIGR02147 family)